MAAPAFRRDPTLDAPPASERTPTEAQDRVALTHEEPTPDEVAVEAYMIYVARGHADGRDMDDWLEAERALRARRATAAASSDR